MGRSGFKRLFIVGIWLMLSAALVWSQTSGNTSKSKPTPDLSGTWKLKQTKSAGAQSAATANETTIVIVQKEPEIKMTRSSPSGGQDSKRELIYYTDERGETNFGAAINTRPGLTEQPIQSTTTWKKNKLVSTARVQKSLSGSFFSWKIIDEWKLSTDGQTLTQTTIIRFEDSSDMMKGGSPGRSSGLPSWPIFVPAGSQEFKLVFSRVP